MIEKITRQQEQDIPPFKDHEQARAWFKGRYGGNFAMTDSEVIDGRKIYFYHLILDAEEYIKGRNRIAEGKIITGTDYLFSYQPIEIDEHGHVHVIH